MRREPVEMLRLRDEVLACARPGVLAQTGAGPAILLTVPAAVVDRGIAALATAGSGMQGNDVESVANECRTRIAERRVGKVP